MERIDEPGRAFGKYASARATSQNDIIVPRVKKTDRQDGEFTFRSSRPLEIAQETLTAGESKAEILKKARESMVMEQMLPGGVTAPRILDAFMQVPRDLFIPALKNSALAYADATIPIGAGRFIIEPRALGALMQEAYIQPTHRIFDIACGTGYATAVFSKLAEQVTGVESDAELARQARANMEQLAIDNVSIISCNFADLPKTVHDEFDVILINGAVHDVPESFARLLSEDGILLTIKRVYQYLARPSVYRKMDGKLYHRALGELSRPEVPLLPEFTNARQFDC